MGLTDEQMHEMTLFATGLSKIKRGADCRSDVTLSGEEAAALMKMIQLLRAGAEGD